MCPACGVATGASRVSHEAIVLTQRKSAGIAILLSFLIPGIGQFYAGSAGKGVMFLVFNFINFLLMFIIIGFFTYACVWVWSMIDANMTANSYNTKLLMSAA